VQFNLTGKTPTSVYFGIQMQQVSYPTYQSTASGNALWIQGARDWSQYAVVPQGSMVSLLATTPNGGSGNLILVDASGQNYSYFFYPVSQLGFYADVPGRHALSFVADGVASNIVVIDVSGTVTMTYDPASEYYPPKIYNSVKSLENYPGYNVRFDSNAPQGALDNAALNKVNQKMFSNYDINNPYAWDYGAYQWINSP
jgi:hypothetical protein